MTEKNLGPVGITDTTFRDAHQSLLATRMKTEDLLPIAEAVDEIGFHSVEMWGGATFDTAMRFLNEDPWERLRVLKKKFKKTKTQMLLRGQNLVGYRHYADDMVEEFIKKAVANGMDIFRIFDALNDVRNMEKAIEVAKKEGAHVQATISYTLSQFHDLAYYMKLAKELQELGADSICIKDMAGIISPKAAYDLVDNLKEKFGLPVQLHCHYTSGMASMAYYEAARAGVDVIDCAISTLALQTSQPAIESMVAALADTERATGLDLGRLSDIAEYFKKVREKYAEYDLASVSVDTNVLRYQIPGGMISNFYAQLKQQNALDKLPLVLEEVPRVRADFGYPPLVTPSSQIVGSQAVLNVMAKERYKIVTNEVRAYMKGQYGQPPAPVNEEVRKKIIRNQTPITCRPADEIPPMLEEARAKIGDKMKQEEDLLTYLMFPPVAEKFFEERDKEDK